MKTPRDILWQRHRAANSKLDAVRRRVLGGMGEETEPRRMSSLWRMFERFVLSDGRQAWKSAPRKTGRRPVQEEGVSGFVELIVSLRWHLMGLSAAWLIIAVLNMDPSPKSTAKMEAKAVPSPHQLMAAIRENRRQLLEVMEWSVAEHGLEEAQKPAPARTPQNEAPRRRSELKDLRQEPGADRMELA